MHPGLHDSQVGDTPLILAVCLERWPCAHLLLARGGAAAIKARDAMGWAPIHHAVACLRAAAGLGDPAAAAWLEAAAAEGGGGPLRAAAEAEVAAAGTGSGVLERFRGARGEVGVRADGAAYFRCNASVWGACHAAVRGTCLCPDGEKGYYELEVLEDGLWDPRWGFCSGQWPRLDSATYEGVGLDPGGLSWGVDGVGALKWHGGRSEAFGRRWRKGDVIGLACELPKVERVIEEVKIQEPRLLPNGQWVMADVQIRTLRPLNLFNPFTRDCTGRFLPSRPSARADGGRILVSVNGDFSHPNGAAFDLPADLFGLHPAFTCLAGAVRCNLGGDPARPLRHAPPATDYRAMATFLPARAPDEPPVPH